MSTHDKRVPELRFKGFVEDWEQRKLGEYAEFNPKSTLPNEFEYVDLESVIGTNLVTYRTEKKDTAPSRAQRLARKGDVFYQTVRPYQKNNYLYDLPYDNYVFSTGYAQMRPKVDSYFLLSLIQEEKFVQRVLNRSTGTGYPAINSTDLAEIEVQVPTEIDEQKVIGDLFRMIDDTIALHQRKYDKLILLKKAILQSVFPEQDKILPQLKFTNNEVNWEQRTLDSMVDRVRSYSLSRSVETSEYTGYKYIHYGDIHTNVADIVNQYSNLPNIERGDFELLKKGDLVLADASEDYQGIAKPAVITVDTDYNLVSGSHTIALRPNNVDSIFLYYLFHSPVFRRYGYKTGTGMKVFGISVANVLKFQAKIPPLNEQIKIGSFLREIDNIIVLQQTSLEHLQTLKKEYLEKMFI